MLRAEPLMAFSQGQRLCRLHEAPCPLGKFLEIHRYLHGPRQDSLEKALPSARVSRTPILKTYHEGQPIPHLPVRYNTPASCGKIMRRSEPKQTANCQLTMGVSESEDVLLLCPRRAKAAGRRESSTKPGRYKLILLQLTGVSASGMLCASGVSDGAPPASSRGRAPRSRIGRRSRCCRSPPFGLALR